jgi:hypothetical protein
VASDLSIEAGPIRETPLQAHWGQISVPGGLEKSEREWLMEWLI